MAPPVGGDDGGGGGGGGGGSVDTPDTATGWIDRLNQLTQVGSLDNAFTKLLLVPITAFFLQAANLIEAAFNILNLPLSAIGVNVSDLVDSVIGGAANIVGAGSGASAGQVEVFGIAGFPVALALIGVSAFVLATVVSADATSNFFPFALADVPFLGTEEEE